MLDNWNQLTESMRNNHHRVGYSKKQGLRNEILHERVFPMGVAVKTVVPKPCYDTTPFWNKNKCDNL